MSHNVMRKVKNTFELIYVLWNYILYPIRSGSCEFSEPISTAAFNVRDRHGFVHKFPRSDDAIYYHLGPKGKYALRTVFSFLFSRFYATNVCAITSELYYNKAVFLLSLFKY